MSADRPPSQRSVHAQLNRRQALGLAAAVAVGSLATSAGRATATAAGGLTTTWALPARSMGRQEPVWAAWLTDVIRRALVPTSIPGAIVGVWQDGQPPYVRAFGVQDTTTDQPMTPDLYMRIGSNTKSFTTTAILQLVDQGKIGLDDPIDKYVQGAPNGNRITIRQLAGMRSGLFDYSTVTIPRWPGEPQRQWTAPELLAIAFGQPPIFEPDAEFDYNNTNTVLLGEIVEKVTGQSIRAYVNEHIVQPEGLTHTFFPVGAEFPAPHSRGYWRTPDGALVDNTDWNFSWGDAAGQMVSTLDDLRIWARDLATGTLLSPATQREREKFLPAEDEGQGVVYGLGMTDNNGWRGHDGNVLSQIAYPFYLPSQQMTLVVLLNSSIDALDSVAVMQAITGVISPNNVWPNPPVSS
ncbi:MAG TPA: serine hydrolase domain-containing protein [Chloroflexota bacterium]|jgi:D-alanyl-D-alanine carboxypeptidase